MKIAILSDTHDHIVNIEWALRQLRAQGPKHVFHCGDVTSLSSLQWFSEYPITLTFGNGDSMTGEMRNYLHGLDSNNAAEYRFDGVFHGKRIGMTHGHLPGVLESMMDSQEFEYVFTGHEHVRSDQTVGRTRVINPGALGGSMPELRSLCILDLESGDLNFIIQPG